MANSFWNLEWESRGRKSWSESCSRLGLNCGMLGCTFGGSCLLGGDCILLLSRTRLFISDHWVLCWCQISWCTWLVCAGSETGSAVALWSLKLSRLSVSWREINALINRHAISDIGIELDREKLSQRKQPVSILTQLMLVFVDQSWITTNGLMEIVECPLSLTGSEQCFSLDGLQPVDVF